MTVFDMLPNDNEQLLAVGLVSKTLPVRYLSLGNIHASSKFGRLFYSQSYAYRSYW
jgi:hypothetical protein